MIRSGVNSPRLNTHTMLVSVGPSRDPIGTEEYSSIRHTMGCKIGGEEDVCTESGGEEDI